MAAEDVLRSALRAEADRADGTPSEATWELIRRRAGRRRRARQAGMTVAAVAAALVIAVLSVDGSAPREVEVVPADPGTTATEPSVPSVFTAGSDDATTTARAFAVEYLHMPAPVVAEVPGDTADARVEVRPRAGHPMVTIVALDRSPAGTFVVTGASTRNIVVDRPSVGEAVGTTIGVSGTSTAFEATIAVEIRQDDGRVLGKTTLLGGANGELGPFGGDLTVDPPTTDAGAAVFTTVSSEDGSVQEATVIPLRFGTPSRAPGGLARYSVYFHRGADLVESGREGPGDQYVLRAALVSLLSGPYLEMDGEDAVSPFSAASADLLEDVRLDSSGTVVVDLRGEVPGVSTDEARRRLLAELYATLFQFSTVDRAEIRLRGSCDAFYEWLQQGSCRVVDRDDLPES
jgi:hypothetical protein